MSIEWLFWLQYEYCNATAESLKVATMNYDACSPEEHRF